MSYIPSFEDQLDVDYISHHGIKGQKWGVRRYQNADGSYTAQGKKHRNGPIRAAKNKWNSMPKYRRESIKDAAILAGYYGATAATMYGIKKLTDKIGEAPGNWRTSSPGGGYYNDQSSNNSRPNKRAPTSHNKSTDREARIRNSKEKLDYGKADKEVKDLAKKVAKAQQDGTLTPEMIDALQEAKARKKIAKEQLEHGFICMISRSDDPSSYLMHHGIKGQKWGVRRFQNTDGSYTIAGQRRYSDKDRKKYARKAQRTLNNLDRQRVQTNYDLDKYESKNQRKLDRLEKKGPHNNEAAEKRRVAKMNKLQKNIDWSKTMRDVSDLKYNVNVAKVLDQCKKQNVSVAKKQVKRWVDTGWQINYDMAQIKVLRPYDGGTKYKMSVSS